MTVFVDTSALYALLASDDADHAEVTGAFRRLHRDREELITHSYVVVEAAALAHRRLGADAVRALLQDLLATVAVEWIDGSLHTAAVSALLAALPTRVSLVDFVSFEVMRRGGIQRAFALDSDFTRAGFELLP